MNIERIYKLVTNIGIWEFVFDHGQAMNDINVLDDLKEATGYNWDRGHLGAAERKIYALPQIDKDTAVKLAKALNKAAGIDGNSCLGKKFLTVEQGNGAEIRVDARVLKAASQREALKENTKPLLARPEIKLI